MKTLNFDPSTICYSDIMDRLTLHRKAIGFVADRIEDRQASANLHLIELAMEETEEWLNLLNEKNAVEESLASEDVPFA